MGFWKIIKEIFWPISRSDLDDYYEESFRLWAFGNKKKLSNSDAVRCWNAIHSDLMTIQLNGLINEDLEKMKSFYDKHLEQVEAEMKLIKELDK